MKITLGEVIEGSNVAELLSGGAVIELNREGHTGCGFLIWRMENDERSLEQEQFAHDLVAALDELTSLRAFKKACESQSVAAIVHEWRNDGPCGLNDRAGVDVNLLADLPAGSTLYSHPDPEAASLRLSAQHERDVAEAYKAEMDSIDWLDTQGTPEAHAARDELTSLRAFKAACEGQGAVAYGVLEGRDTTSCGWDYIASFAEACHDHINEAISTYDITEAGQWKVVPLYEHPNPEAAELRMRVEELESQLLTCIENPDDPAYWLHSAAVLLKGK